MTDLRIKPCVTPKDAVLFERVPELLHGDNPFFLPPFPGTVKAFLNPSHPFHQAGEIHPFIAYRGARPVGRIAAVINRTHNEHSQDALGFFGFCDFADDAEVSAALFSRAEDILRVAERSGMRGPYSPSSNDECGLLVKGFESPPMVMMPYNPPYYEQHYEAYGLSQVMDLHSYRLTDPTTALERTERIAARLKRNAGIHVRCADMKKFDEEIRILHFLYNETLSQQWGFVPVSFDELLHAAKDLKQVLDPQLVLIAEKDGKPVGISVSIPNINEFMITARRSRGLLRMLRFAWQLKTRRPQAVRLAILGVLPGDRNKGVAPAFYFESLMRGIGRYTEAEMGWVLDNNAEVNKAARLLGADQHKTHRIYEKPITSS